MVVHCKAGKGRSGTAATSYLISEEAWSVNDALQRFTERRMRHGFGQGVSIPSQLRWINYVDTWTQFNKVYVERPVEIIEIHVWGIRDGVKMAVEGYIEEGRKIKTLHVFQKGERYLENSAKKNANGHMSEHHEVPTNDIKHTTSDATKTIDTKNQHLPAINQRELNSTEIGGNAVIFRSANPILVPTSDVCIDIERRTRASYGLTMVSAVAHVWFNVFFEGLVDPAIRNPSSASYGTDSGVFEIEWDALDGLKGSSKKGTRALDKIAIVWRTVEKKSELANTINVPKPGEAVPETKPANWQGADTEDIKPYSEKSGTKTDYEASTDLDRVVHVKESEKSNVKDHIDHEDSMQQVKKHRIDQK